MSSSSAREQKGGGDRVDALSATPQLSYARSRDGVTLAFAVTGQGPTLVLVPSVPFSNLQMEYGNPVMRQVYGELASRVTLLQYDGRGTGHSQRDVVDLSLEAMLADTAAHCWMGWAAGEAGRATAEAFRQAVTPQVARATLQAASATDVTAELARVQAPTLVLHRRDAPQVAIEVSRSLADSLPHGRLVIL